MVSAAVKSLNLDVSGIYYRDLNAQLRTAVNGGIEKIELQNVCGQRYLGTNLDRSVEIDIYGTPGNDLGAFMDGPKIRVFGNAQDGCGNTMNEGQIVVYGHAGDIVGLSARGGKIFIKEDVGYRAGIHMKEYKEKKPILVIGGTAQDFAGEYMAGGVMILLGLGSGGHEQHKARFIGTGMHGGVIYLRGNVEDHQLGKEVGITEPDDDDIVILKQYVNEFCQHFDYDSDTILDSRFMKLYPKYLRPYGRLYTY